MPKAPDTSSPEAAAARIAEAFDRMRNAFQPTPEVVDSFRGLLIEHARFKESLPSLPLDSIPEPDPEKFGRGVPLAHSVDLVGFDKEMWKQSAEAILPQLEEGFPKIRKEIESLRRAIASGDFDVEASSRDMLASSDDKVDKAALSLGIQSETLRFALNRIVKPLVERRAQSLQSKIARLHWSKGYCPLCGSVAELGFLKETVGQQWLRCSFCAHEWRFRRAVCPFCENEDHSRKMSYYVEGMERERVEACDACGRYLINLDIRDSFEGAPLEVAPLGLMHLDALAQEKGYLPLTVVVLKGAGPEDAGGSERKNRKELS